MNVALAYDLLTAFLLVFTRLTTFFFIAPPFAGQHFSPRFRATLAFAVGVAVAPMVRPKVSADYWESLVPFVGALGFQILVGLTLGFSVRVLFGAFQAAGNYVDMTGGFAMASMFDPVSGTQSSVVGRVTNILATALLFSSGGHLVMLNGLLGSFDLRMTKEADTGAIAEAMIHNFSQLFASALQMAAPVLAVLFLADLALGLVSRAVPSMNVFQLSFPIKLLLTLTLISVFVIVFPAAISEMVGEATGKFPAFIDMLGGGG